MHSRVKHYLNIRIMYTLYSAELRNYSNINSYMSVKEECIYLMLSNVERNFLTAHI